MSTNRAPDFGIASSHQNTKPAARRPSEELMNQENREELREIPGFPHYLVSSMGRVFRTVEYHSSGRIIPLTAPIPLSCCQNDRGYLVVNLNANGKKYLKRVHVLVLTAFRGPCPAGMEGCHENRNRADARLENLRWDTRLGNNADKIKHGMSLYGQKNFSAKLTDDLVRQIRKTRDSGASISTIARQFGVGQSTISGICSFKRWRHVQKESAA